jgi:hypothetical protein
VTAPSEDRQPTIGRRFFFIREWRQVLYLAPRSANSAHCQVSEARLGPNTIERMNGLIIYVNWEYFLGLVGTLVAIAYYANGRFTRLETSIEWLKEALRSLNIASENAAMKLFEARSPVSLSRAGSRILKESGLEAYIDEHQNELIKLAKLRRVYLNPYDLQACSFRLFAEVPFTSEFEHHVNEFAFAKGLSIQYLRRVGAIHFRDLLMASRRCG